IRLLRLCHVALLLSLSLLYSAFHYPPLILLFRFSLFFFFFNDTATTEIYTLSLHDALPISSAPRHAQYPRDRGLRRGRWRRLPRSEEHTSELQSRFDLVCRLLLEKKKKKLTRTCYPISNSPLIYTLEPKQPPAPTLHQISPETRYSRG